MKRGEDEEGLCEWANEIFIWSESAVNQESVGEQLVLYKSSQEVWSKFLQ